VVDKNKCSYNGNQSTFEIQQFIFVNISFDHMYFLMIRKEESREEEARELNLKL